MNEEFKQELKALLEKYNAEICVEMEGDTHGCSCEVVIDVNNVELIRRDNVITHYDL